MGNKVQGNTLGLELTSSFSLEATGLRKSSYEWVEVILLSTFPTTFVQHSV